MRVEYCAHGGLRVVQGFDRELNEQELQNLKFQMRQHLLKQLEFEHQQTLQTYQEKLQTVHNQSI